MAGPADEAPGGLRESAEKLFYAGVGAAAITKERADELAEELARKGQISRDDARQTIEDVTGRWRSEASRVTERAGFSLGSLFRELGLVTRREYDELELRLAQIEHRLRLVEKEPEGSGPPA
jgi:polyhydroxyalkanoate synthesis regulator phasin